MAAGLGFKTFTTGEVLSAGDTNGYLMQGVLVFATAAARDAAITSPQEGQACYLKSTDAVMTYSGSAWVAVGGAASFTTGTTDVATSQSTTSTSYVDLATVQSATVTTGTKALVIIKTDVQNGASFNVGGLMSYAVSGASTIAASDTTNTGLRFFAGNGNLQLACGAAFLQTGLTAGSNVFTAKFKCDSGNSVTFLNRRIQVIDLGS
jgi:hypothetical protein